MSNEEAVKRGIENAFSWAAMHATESIQYVSAEWTRPSVLFRPTVAPDGDQWCALYGPDIMEGVCGFGDTPEAAMRDFDENWAKERTPTAQAKGDGS